MIQLPNFLAYQQEPMAVHSLVLPIPLLFTQLHFPSTAAGLIYPFRAPLVGAIAAVIGRCRSLCSDTKACRSACWARVMVTGSRGSGEPSSRPATWDTTGTWKLPNFQCRKSSGNASREASASSSSSACTGRAWVVMMVAMACSRRSRESASRSAAWCWDLTRLERRW